MCEYSHTKEATAKQRATARENWLEKYGVPYNPTSMAALHSEEAAENRRTTCLERYGVDNHFKILGKVANAKRKLKESMTSEELEARFQHVVEPLNYEYNGVVHKYFPDFKTDAGIIEIKGSHLLPGSCKLGNKGLTQAKFKCMEANSVIIITDVSVYIKYCNEHNFNLMEYKKNYNET